VINKSTLSKHQPWFGLWSTRLYHLVLWGGSPAFRSLLFPSPWQSKIQGSFNTETTVFSDVMPCASIFRVQVKLKLPLQQRVINIFCYVLPCASNFRVELMPKVPSKYWYPSTRVWWCHNPEHNPNLYCHINFILIPMSEGEGQGWFHKPSLPQILAVDKRIIWRTLLGGISRRPKYEIKRRICIHFFYFSHVTDLRN
jgi:hypothetical protein